MEPEIRERDARVGGYSTLSHCSASLDGLGEDCIGALQLTDFPERSTQSGQEP